MSSSSESVTVAVCTFRRAELEDTLVSLATQQVPESMTFEVLVIDNDITPSAAALVDDFKKTAPVRVRYVHCPASNISIARNGALETSDARYLAFIDDDEVAEPGWLAALFGTMGTTGADVVLGPVKAIYSQATPGWMRQLDTHSTAPVDVGGTIRTGYSCNVLIDRACPALSGLRFNLDLGQSGGEDTAFFTHAYRRGAHFALAAPAIVHEKVPPSRARFSWLARRRFRAGQTHGRLLRETAGYAARLKGVGLASLKVAYCTVSATLNSPNAARRNAAVLRGTLHLGTISGLIGTRPITLYGATTDGPLQ